MPSKSNKEVYSPNKHQIEKLEELLTWVDNSREYFPDFLYKYVGDRSELAGEGYETIRKLVDKLLVDSTPVRSLEPPFYKKFMKYDHLR